MRINVQDAPAIAAEPTPTAATTHTVTIEYLTPAELGKVGFLSHNPRRAVIGHRGNVRLLVAVEGDAFLRATLEDIAQAHAAYHGATYIPPAATACDWCGATECADRFDHARLNAGRDRIAA